jgi:hypothetical protein
MCCPGGPAIMGGGYMPMPMPAGYPGGGPIIPGGRIPIPNTGLRFRLWGEGARRGCSPIMPGGMPEGAFIIGIMGRGWWPCMPMPMPAKQQRVSVVFELEGYRCGETNAQKAHTQPHNTRHMQHHLHSHLPSCPAGLVAEAEEQPSRWRRRRRRMAGMMPKTIGKGAWRGWGRARELNRALRRQSSKRAGFDLDLYQP